MLKQVNWPKSGQYKTGSEREPFEFYLNALANSTQFDLLLGYFSFSAINVLSLGFAKFIYNGGKMRVVANHILSYEDKETIQMAKEPSELDNLVDLSNIQELKQKLDAYGKHFFNCLAYLIAKDRIELVFVKPKKGKGLSHYKSGVFSDGENEVKFEASCNFTVYGLVENLEKLEIRCLWEGETARYAIQDQKSDFDNLFSGKSDLVEHIPINNLQTAIKDQFGDPDIDELLTQEEDLAKAKRKGAKNRIGKKVLEQLENEIQNISTQPTFPFEEGPRQYQIDAYNNWVDNGYQGIFAMATGTGKTITALNCLLEEAFKTNNGYYNAIILVPTITLVNQWEEECHKFNFQEVIKISSKNNGWERQLATTLSTAKRIAKSFVIISTYASFTKERFNKYIKRFPENTILVADEAHNMGASSVANKIKTINLPKRIGLSATPKRVYDPEGTAAMESFFNDQEPYTLAFPLERAIKEGYLCSYDYHPHIVNLTGDELESYIEITKKLAKFYNPAKGGFEESEAVEKLLLRRKQVIHKASNKITYAQNIVKNRFKEKGHAKYTFVYVPEGKPVDVTEQDEDEENAQDDVKLIDLYTKALGTIDNSIMVNKFVSGMPNRNEVLEQFKKGQIDILASMKCLDEGVDVPRAEHAIFCASTGNPRQFIQRRGRILRNHPDKSKAIIHDLIVVPDLSESDIDSDTFKIEKSLVRKELERVMYFASLSDNPYETEETFSEICNHYNLNIYTIHKELASI